VAAQFAFLAFLLGHSLESFGQWKALLHLALACEEAPLQTRPGFYSKLLAAVRAQLQHCLASGRCAAEFKIKIEVVK
jgi:A1 cistron-splicing factor AAR2